MLQVDRPSLCETTKSPQKAQENEELMNHKEVESLNSRDVFCEHSPVKMESPLPILIKIVFVSKYFSRLKTWEQSFCGKLEARKKL